MHPNQVNRRRFLGGIGGVAAATVVSGIRVPSVGAEAAAADDVCVVGPLDGVQRAHKAYKIRERAAKYERDLPLPAHPCNGDEGLFANRIGSFSKGLPHNDLGEVDPAAYDALLTALESGRHDDFEGIPLGGVRKLANPQAAYCFALEAPDSHHLDLPAAPAFASAERAGEMAEVYWQALTRDVAFVEYDTHALTRSAASDLSALSAFSGPKADGRVTTGTLFRGDTPGDLTGPYLSQFLWKDVPYGPTTVAQRYRGGAAGVDYATSYDDWLALQRGAGSGPSLLDDTSRYIRNGRDLGEWVHQDFPYQGFLNAALILLAIPGTTDSADPYRNSLTQGSFVTFGGAYILDLVARVAIAALKAAWYQKWLVHRTLRPEAYAGRVHNHLTGAASYPLHDDIVTVSAAPHEVFAVSGSHLLPLAYPEGSPTHPAYPAGHATIAGACATMLKACMNESAVMPSPVVASADGLTLHPYTGPDLTVGGELDKLAANISLGRDTAGVHYRTDGTRGMLLGEDLAIKLLTEMRATYNERFAGFSLTRFDGTTVTI
jgi:hypothetical protein